MKRQYIEVTCCACGTIKQISCNGTPNGWFRTVGRDPRKNGHQTEWWTCMDEKCRRALPQIMRDSECEKHPLAIPPRKDIDERTCDICGHVARHDTNNRMSGGIPFLGWLKVIRLGNGEVNAKSDEWDVCCKECFARLSFSLYDPNNPCIIGHPMVKER